MPNTPPPREYVRLTLSVLVLKDDAETMKERLLVAWAGDGDDAVPSEVPFVWKESLSETPLDDMMPDEAAEWFDQMLKEEQEYAALDEEYDADQNAQGTGAVMPNPMYDRILQHVGHRLVAVRYAGGENVAVECEKCHEVLCDADRPSPGTVQAVFQPQRWENDNAVDVSLEHIAALAGEYPVTMWEPREVPQVLLDQLEQAGGAAIIDRDDLLKNLDDTPQWIQDWDGPCTIWVGRVDDQEPPSALEEAFSTIAQAIDGDEILLSSLQQLRDALLQPEGG